MYGRGVVGGKNGNRTLFGRGVLLACSYNTPSRRGVRCKAHLASATTESVLSTAGQEHRKCWISNCPSIYDGEPISYRLAQAEQPPSHVIIK